MESVPPIGILSAKSGKTHFIPLTIITAEAVVRKHIASQDRNSQWSESGYVYLATFFNIQIRGLADRFLVEIEEKVKMQKKAPGAPY
jgi:hypothetical protein